MSNDVETEPDLVGDAPAADLALRRPDVPITLNELAARKGEALEILDARVQILATLRKAALRATSPEDWLLFKAPEEHGGQITGYLQDCGGERIRDLFGIEIYDVGRPEKILTNDPKHFHYLVSGSGRCKLTKQVIESIEGGRSSTEDFCKDKEGADLELSVRKAARANLDGRVVRELAGMSNVPIEELRAAWEGTTKSTDRCRRGRGFGTRDERVGGFSEKAPDVEPPICPHCQSKGVYRPASAKNKHRAFYGCPKWETHKDKKFIVDAAEWLQQQASSVSGGGPNVKPSAAGPPAASAVKSPQQGDMLTADQIFKGREPGQEG